MSRYCIIIYSSSSVFVYSCTFTPIHMFTRLPMYISHNFMYSVHSRNHFTHSHVHAHPQASCMQSVVRTQPTVTNPWRSTTQSQTSGRVFPTCTWLAQELGLVRWTASSTSLVARTGPYTTQQSNATSLNRTSGGGAPT